MMKLKLLILTLFLAAANVFAQSENWQTYGYAKYLFSVAENKLISNENLIDHQVHFRLNNRWYPTSNLTAGLEFRIRGFYGGMVEKTPGFKSTVITNYPFADLKTVLWHQNSSLGYGQVDRLFFDYTSGSWQFTIGRQRIAWGTSLVWNVIDLFNPQSILDFDYEEKPGSDAIRVQYYTGAIGRLEAVYKPAKNSNKQTAALLWLFNNWDYDFYLISAIQNNSPLFAAAFSGDIRGAGFRGEFKYTKPPSRDQLQGTLLPFGENYSQANSKNISAVLSSDYTFPSSFYLHSEVLYNSIGKTEYSGLYTFQAVQAGLLSPSRWSLFFETAYDLHPLVRGDFFVLHNPQDNSSIFVPSISWSVITNLDLYLIGFLTEGPNLSEFGNYGKAFYLRTKYSF
ncbi:MAG: hypothetical protein KDF60_06285 [Calditrichaeota bacterium]|nr:hypothetical protein [Calditrichota bacterium]